MWWVISWFLTGIIATAIGWYVDIIIQGEEVKIGDFIGISFIGILLGWITLMIIIIGVIQQLNDSDIVIKKPEKKRKKKKVDPSHLEKDDDYQRIIEENLKKFKNFNG